MKQEEVEVKFYIKDLKAQEAQLRSLGAQLTQPRTFEQNLRFDTPDKLLAKGFKVLRLRRDVQAHLTFKGPSEDVDGVRVRKEIEFVLADFQAAWQLLLELGYLVSMRYDKYRAVYDLLGVQISLDELPYGNFLEIEGPDPATIHTISTMLGLNWEARVPESYTVLFEQIQVRMMLNFNDLIFDNFANLDLKPSDLHVIPADE